MRDAGKPPPWHNPMHGQSPQPPANPDAPTPAPSPEPAGAGASTSATAQADGPAAKPAPKPSPPSPVPRPSSLMLLDVVSMLDFSASTSKDGATDCDTLPPEQKTCCISTLEIKCGHSKRGFTLIPPDTETNAEKTQLIRLVANDDGTDTLELKLEGGPCVQGRPTGAGSGAVQEPPGDGVGKSPSIKIGPYQVLSPAKVKLEAPRKHAAGPVMLLEFMRIAFGDDPEKDARSYSGGVTACEGGSELGFRVEVYPKRKWEGKISFGAELAKVEKASPGTGASGPGKPFKVKNESKFKLEGSISFEESGRSTSIELPSFERKDKGGNDLAFGATQKLFEEVLPKLGDFLGSDLVKLKPKWPKVSLSGEAELIEIKGKYDVGWQGKAKLECDPLIGLEGTLDILEALIRLATVKFPPAGKMLSKIRKAAEKERSWFGVSAKAAIKLDLIAGGKISGALDYTWVPQDTNKAGGKIRADLDLEVKGSAGAGLSFFVVTFDAGVSISAKSGAAGEIGAEFKGFKPKLKGGIEFKGLTIKSAGNLSSGGSFLGTSKEGKADPTAKKKGKWKPMSAGIKESTKAEFFSIEVLKKRRWPDSDSAGLDKGEMI